MEPRTKTYYEQELDRIASENASREDLYARVRRARVFMEKHLDQEIELDKIAASAFMSRFHFIRKFQEVYGLTPRQYLRDLRIAKAKELLRNGLPVTTVCFDVGYSSLPTFSKIFKRGTGFSPKTFQKLNKSNPE